MLKGRDIVIISSIDWSFLWQAPQEIALRLSRAGNRVLFVENTGVRTPVLRDFSRMKTRLLDWVRTWRTSGAFPIEGNLRVCSPLVLPPFGPAWRRSINRRLLLPRIARIAAGMGMRDPILFTFLPTDTALEIIGSLRTNRSVVVYYCGADFAQLASSAADLAVSERRVLSESDLVLATCSELIRHCQAFNPNVHACPNGVDLTAFATEAVRPGSIDDSSALGKNFALIHSLPRPIVGYVGGLHCLVDFPLLKAVARARPDWSWVFVGPIQAPSAGIGDLQNVHLLGQQPHSTMAHYIRLFDVGIVPYLNCPRTRTVVPVKILHYLAAGKPVVSTDLATVQEFNREHGVLMTSDNEPASFLQAIERALGCLQDDVLAARRRKIAAQYDWQSRLEQICSLIELHLRRIS
jgi:glycosyltransferase involved in cell wall biosynthesis